MMKKILSLILCLSILAGTLITSGLSVYADEIEAMIGSTEYATLEEALDAADNGEVITLMSDATVEKTLEVSNTLTLHSDNGSAVTLAGSAGGSLVDITGALTLTGVTLRGGSDYTVTLSGGTLTLLENSWVSDGVYINGGVLNFKGGAISGLVKVEDEYSTLRMSGSATFTDVSQIYLPFGSYIDITGKLTGTGDINIVTYSASIGDRVAILSAGIGLDLTQLERFKIESDGTVYTALLNGNDIILDKPAGSNEVARIGDTAYSTLAEAFDAAAAVGNATVTLVANATVYSPITVKGNITLDADGNYTVISDFSLAGSAFVVSKGSALKLSDADNILTVEGRDNGSALFDVQGNLSIDSSVAIRGNINTSERYNKGAVYVNGGSFNMTGGAITENHSASGTVYVESGSFNMTGGVIINNNAKGAGGVYVAGGSFNLSGGSIYANTGDGVWAKGSFALSGSGAIYSSSTYPATVFLSEGAKIKAVSSWKPSAAPAGYTNVIPIAMTEPKLYDVVAEFDAAPISDYFKMSDRYENKFALIAKDKSLIIAAADAVYTVYWGNNPYMTIEEAVAALPDNTAATLKVVGDSLVSAPVVIKQGMNITITTDKNPANLEDYSLRIVKRGADFTDAIFRIEKGATLTLQADTDKGLVFDGENKPVKSAMVVTAGGFVVGNGVILKANNNRSAEVLTGNNRVFTFGGGVYIEKGGSCTLGGGSIAGHYASYGAGIYVNDGALNISGGEVTSNVALYGAGIYLETSGTDAAAFAALAMTGGIIYSNNATNVNTVPGSGVAGGVYIGNGSTFMMSGGDLEKNSAALASGVCVGTAVYAENIPEPQFVISAKASIATDNTVLLAIPGISYVLVSSALTAQKGAITLSLPTPMPQNMKLAAFYYGENQITNDTAARNAATKGLFALDKSAAEYFNVSVCEAEKNILVNTAGDYILPRAKSGKHHNGLDMYVEGDTAPAEGETRTAISYGSVVIHEKGSFTAYYEMSYYPNLYENVNTAISAPFPQGTRIVMIESSDEENVGYYYYEVSGDENVVSVTEAVNGVKTPDIIEIPLVNFYKMGTKDTFYEAVVNEDTSAKAVTREKMLFVVDFTDVRADEGESLEGEFTMVWNHYYPGDAEGERYDISGNIARSVYKVSNTATSTLTLAVGEDNTFDLSYALTDDSAALAQNKGVFLFQLGYGTFPRGTVLTDAEGKQYVSSGKATVIAVPIPCDGDGNIIREGSLSLTVSNYYGTALVNASVRCVIAASADGTHYTVGAAYDAESEGVKFELEAGDEYSVLVTTPDGEKKPYYESYDVLKESSALEMTVKGLANTVEVESFNLTLLKKQGEEYLPCELSELFDVSADYGSEVILNTGNLSLKLASGINRLMGNEYKISFRVGDAVEYVKVNVIEAE